MDAVAPIAAMPLLYPELGPAHQVREVWIQWVDDPNTWVDISETLELKIQALLQHRSQVGEEVAERVRQWAYQAGRGLVPAEAFKVIFLKKREPERSAHPE